MVKSTILNPTVIHYINELLESLHIRDEDLYFDLFLIADTLCSVGVSDKKIIKTISVLIMLAEIHKDKRVFPLRDELQNILSIE